MDKKNLLNKMNKFKACDEYIKDTETYAKADGIIAIIAYVILVAAYYVIGVFVGSHNIPQYIAYIFNVLFLIALIVITIIRKQKVETLGFNYNNLKKSLAIGAIIGAVGGVVNLVISGAIQFVGVSSAAIILCIQIFAIAIPEEIIFRGYIEKRLHGLCNNTLICSLLTGVMFMLFHIPFTFGAMQISFGLFIASNYLWLLITFVMHFIFSFVYRKTNNIYGSIICHVLINVLAMIL